MCQPDLSLFLQGGRIMKNPLIVGVMGGGIADPKSAQAAYHLGSLIADQGWILLNGGRDAGVMASSAKGARENGGITVGILPDDNPHMASPFIQIPILTGMGNARNCINVLSSHIVVACPGGTGTISEVALALKSERRVILMNFNVKAMFDRYLKKEMLLWAETPEEVIETIKRIFK
jgi:uncharacterized protein (TIGR00725 family)